jgi:hypothetical protein
MKIFRRRMKLPRDWFRRKWLFAFVGSALILASTFATGYIVDRQERRAKDAEGQAREAAQALEQSERRQQVATDTLHQVLSQEFSLGTILAGGSSAASRVYEVINSSVQENKVSQTRRVIDLLEEAAGPDVDEKVVAEYRRLNEREAKGQNVETSQWAAASTNLQSEVDNYQEQLRTRQDNSEKEKDAAERNSTTARLFALTLQVVGLVLLLIKEVPLESKKGASAPQMSRAKAAAASR